jgi:CubicO group peptidase (beta-lactamase class C family)
MKNTILFLLLFVSTILFSQTIKRYNLDEFIKKAQESHSEGLIVYQDNKLITEKYFGIGKPTTKIEAMSSTKSIVGLAVACLLDDKLLDSLDVPVYKFYPEWNQGQKKLITIRHLVNMTSGLQNELNAAVEIYPSKNFVQLGLCAELTNKPGEKFVYNNKSLNLMAGVFKKITGKRMDKYIGERLFKPLGINDFTWSLDNSGNPHVMSGCQIKPKDFAKIGLLLLNNGKYNNKQIISKKNCAKVIEPCKQNKEYGILWWLDYEKTTIIIDDAKVTEFKNAKLNEEFINKAILMKGVYLSIEEYFKKREIIFGSNSGEYVAKSLNGLSLRNTELSGEIAFKAEGFLGNYIFVDPKTKIVAIRMISGNTYKDDNDGFDDFFKLAKSLTK